MLESTPNESCHERIGRYLKQNRNAWSLLRLTSHGGSCKFSSWTEINLDYMQPAISIIRVHIFAILVTGISCKTYYILPILFLNLRFCLKVICPSIYRITSTFDSTQTDRPTLTSTSLYADQPDLYVLLAFSCNML